MFGNCGNSTLNTQQLLYWPGGCCGTDCLLQLYANGATRYSFCSLELGVGHDFISTAKSCAYAITVVCDVYRMCFHGIFHVHMSRQCCVLQKLYCDVFMVT